jgi:hypothetical protein
MPGISLRYPWTTFVNWLFFGADTGESGIRQIHDGVRRAFESDDPLTDEDGPDGPA